MAKYRVIDADGHFMEPQSVWSEYLDSKYHSVAPKGLIDEQGRYRMSVGGRTSPYLLNTEKAVKGGAKMSAGGHDPAVRLRDMDEEGIEAMVMYTTTGLFFFGVDSLEVTVALCRAFNNWAHDFCRVNPKRLISSAIMPQMDVHASIAELRRAVGELGLNGAFLRPNPIGGRTLDNPDWEPFWSLLEELDVPLVLHEGATQDVPQIGNARYQNFVFRHMICHPFEQQLALLGLIGSGVLERHPKLRVMIVEAGCGWVPYWIERMDHHAEEWAYALPAKLSLKPSEYFRRQCFVSADGEEKMLPEFISCLGDDNLCFSTDYPHPDHPFHGVVAQIADRGDLSEASKRKILGENAARAFKL
jgi:predicted TIM-barrel fold metal-dependent hydrolase